MQIAKQRLPNLVALRRKALIVSDRVVVTRRVTRALGDLFEDTNIHHAVHIEDARQVLRDHNPIGLLCSTASVFDIPVTAFMAKFRKDHSEVPTILYSADVAMAKRIPTDFFVQETGNFDPRFDADEAFLRAAALDALKVPYALSLTGALKRAAKMRPAVHTLEDLDLPATILHYVQEARRVHAAVNKQRDFLLVSNVPDDELYRLSARLAEMIIDTISPLFAFARAMPEYLDSSGLVKLLSYIMAPKLASVGHVEEPNQRRILA